MNPHYVRAYNRNSLTPVAKLIALKLCAGASPQESGEDISLEFVHSIMCWAGCNRVQMIAALDELLTAEMLKAWRWCEVQTRTDDKGPHQAVLCFMFPVEDFEVGIDNEDDERPQTDDIVAGDTAGITKIDPRRARIFSKTDGKCFYCIDASAEHLDHMHPKSRGGTDADENMIGACSYCNTQKNDRTVEEYRAYLAYKRKTGSLREILFYGEKIETAA